MGIRDGVATMNRGTLFFRAGAPNIGTELYRSDGTPAGTFLLKDILGNYEGVPTTSGCRFMAGKPATHDDTLVARYKAAVNTARDGD